MSIFIPINLLLPPSQIQLGHVTSFGQWMVSKMISITCRLMLFLDTMVTCGGHVLRQPSLKPAAA